ncbi:MAG: DUF6090 family protein [Rubricoccaceae bacterium]|nr:DUF6090 family protein [Rubricoccaceae bacterium]
MILRRVIAHVRDQNWTAIAIDFVIVVMGVFIGIQVSNWNDRQAQEQREAVMLAQIRGSVQDDLTALHAQLDRFRQAEAALTDLLAHIEQRAPYDSSLDRAFGLMYGFGYLNLDRAAYESLKSEGIGLISSAPLRAEIASLYEKTYGQLEQSMALEADVVLFMRPYFIEHFRQLRFTVSATPIDYQVLLTDPRFLNLIDYRLQTIRQNQLLHLSAGAEAMSALLASLDAA